MKIAVLEITDESDKAFFTEKLPGSELYFSSKQLESEMENVRQADVIVTRSFSKFTEPILDQLLNLKLVTTRSTGTDHINVELCRKKNITVCNVPDYGEYTVAEHAISLLLAISRQLIPSVERVKKGDFTSDGLRGFELHGKTLGVIGVGSIGKSVIRIAIALGMNVIAFTRNPNEKDAEDGGFTHGDINTVLAQSDIISLHIPATPETHHFLNQEKIRKCKKGIVLINTSRGAVIDSAALIEALENGQIKYAGLDVLENERELGDNEKKLINMEQVLVTPHNAYNSDESLQKILDITVKNIQGFINNDPQNVV